MCKLDSIELTTGMSVTAIDYMYTIYTWQNFSFDEERIGPHVLSWHCILVLHGIFESNQLTETCDQ
jgi:hypothetical protein